jgi:membrane associated rhomboid family serine protease
MYSPYPFTKGVKALLVANGVIYLLQLFPGAGAWLTSAGALVPVQIYGHCQIWRCVTYMFFHSTADFSHLLLNMFALWMFGGVLEERWGTKKFIGLYFLFGTGAALFSVFYLFDPVLRFVPVLGASGAVFGLLTAYAVYYPNRQLLFFFVLPVRAWMIVAGFAVLSLLFAFSQGSGIAHLIHFGGIVVAFCWLRGWPRIDSWYRAQQEQQEEKEIRRRAEGQFSRKRYYEEKVDPILEKIAREGEKTLTKEEKKSLKEVWKFKNENRDKNIF